MEKTNIVNGDIETFVSEVEIHILRGEWETVREKAERRRDACPGDVNACLTLALCLVREGRKEEALRHFEALERSEESSALLYRYGGDVFARQGMIREAMESYRKSSLLHSGHVRWIDRDEPAAPRGAEDFSGDEDEDDRAAVPEGFLTPTMADLYVRQGHYELARSALEKLLSGDPGNGSLRESLRKLEETIRDRQKKRERVLGELYHWLGRLEKQKAVAAPEAGFDA